MLARRVSAEGRTRAFVEGRSATAADLQALGGRLVAFFGQHEHRRLTLASAQLELLDGFCGREQLALRAKLAAAHARVKELEQRLVDLRERAGTRDRDLDLLAFEIEEIEALAPSEEETRRRWPASASGCGRWTGCSRPPAAGPRRSPPRRATAGWPSCWPRPSGLAGAVTGVDPELDGLAGRLAALRIEAEDLGGELRRYADSLEAEPGRLQQVEERLEQYDRLERKHGGSVAAVLEHAERCRERARAARAGRGGDRARRGGARRALAAARRAWRRS